MLVPLEPGDAARAARLRALMRAIEDSGQPCALCALDPGAKALLGKGEGATSGDRAFAFDVATRPARPPFCATLLFASPAPEDLSTARNWLACAALQAPALLIADGVGSSHEAQAVAWALAGAGAGVRLIGWVAARASLRSALRAEGAGRADPSSALLAARLVEALPRSVGLSGSASPPGAFFPTS